MALNAATGSSRRALLVGVTGGVMAAIAGAFGRAVPVSANDPNDVVLGALNSTTTQTEVRNTSPTGTAFVGLVLGVGTGVNGYSAGGAGVQGYSGAWNAVRGTGASDTYPAVLGWSFGGGDNTGLMGYSGDTFNPPASPSKTGVYGYASQDGAAVGVFGESAFGRGGRFKGAKAQIQLKPSTAATHPVSGQTGDIFLDESKRLWLCKGGTTWVRLDT